MRIIDPTAKNEVLTGRLEIITGPMFAGKTTEMLRRLVALKQAGMKVLYMNHVGDTRAVEYIFSTHATSIVKGSDNVPSLAIDSLPPLENVEGFDACYRFRRGSLV